MDEKIIWEKANKFYKQLLEEKENVIKVLKTLLCEEVHEFNALKNYMDVCKDARNELENVLLEIRDMFNSEDSKSRLSKEDKAKLTLIFERFSIF